MPSFATPARARARERAGEDKAKAIVTERLTAVKDVLENLGDAEAQRRHREHARARVRLDAVYVVPHGEPRRPVEIEIRAHRLDRALGYQAKQHAPARQ